MIYIYQGAEFTEEQVSQAAANLGLTVEEYKNKYKLTVKQEDLVGKTTTTSQGALVGGMLAPAELSQTSSLSDLGLTSVSQDDQIATAPSQTTADSLLITEEERNEQKNLISDVALSVAGSFINVAADLAAIPQQMAYLGWEAYDPSKTLAERKRKIDQIEAIGNMVGMVPGIGGMAAMSPGKAQKIEESIEGAKKKYKDEDLLTAIQNGNYADAAAMTVRGVAESASSYAAAAFGWPGMLLLGGAYASDKFQQEILDSEKSVGRIAAASVLTGASEAVLEKVTNKLFFNAKKIGNAEQARKFLEKGLLLTYGKFFGKTQLEALSEDTTEGMNMLIDKFMLGKKITGKEVRHRLFQSHTLGTAGAATIQSVQDYANKGQYTERMATQVLYDSKTQKQLSKNLTDLSKSMYNYQKADNDIDRSIHEVSVNEATNNALNIMSAANAQIRTLKGDNFKQYAKNRDQIYEIDYRIDGGQYSGEALFAARNQRNKLQAMNDQILQTSVNQALEENTTASSDYAEALGYPEIKTFNTPKDFANYKKSINADPSETPAATFVPNGNEILINKQVAQKLTGVTAPQHEVLHGILRATLDKNNQAAEDMSNALDIVISENVGSREFMRSKYYDRLIMYANKYRQKDIAGKHPYYREEMMTVFTDAIATGDLSLNESAATKFGRAVNRILYRYAGVNRKFNKPQDVVDFLIDYNRSIEKGYVDKSITRIAKEGAEGDIFRPLDPKKESAADRAADFAYETKQEIIARNKELLANAGGKLENFTDEQRAEYDDNIQQIKNINAALEPKVPKGVSAESAKLSERVQAIYNEKGIDGFFEIAENMDKFVNKVVNELYKENPEFTEQAMTKDDFKFTLIYGAQRYRKSNTMLQLVSTYKPEKGKTLSQYIMANLKNRGKGLLQQVIGQSPTTGATRIDQAVDSDGASTIDRMEELAIEADFDNIPVAAERRAVSLELKRSYVEGIKEKVGPELEKDLPLYYTDRFKAVLRDRMRQQLTKDMAEAFPRDPATKRGRREKGLEYTEWVKRNIRGIYETFTAEKTIAATAGDLRDIMLDDSKKQLRSFEEVKDQLLEYYIAPKSKTSTDEYKRTVVSAPLKSQHRTQLMNQIADAIGFDAASDILRSNTEIRSAFLKAQEVEANNTLFGSANIKNQSIIDGTLDVLSDKIRNLTILGNLDSESNDKIRRVSYALAEMRAINRDMDILEINKLIMDVLGVEANQVLDIVKTQQELILYQAKRDNVDREKLRELYDNAKDALNLGIPGEENITDFNQFEDLYLNTVAKTSLDFGSKQDIINYLKMIYTKQGVDIPKGLSKMTRAQLMDLFDNIDTSIRKSQTLIEKERLAKRTPLQEEFNVIIEARTGVESSRLYSDVEAHYESRKETFLDRLNIFLPYSAEDFKGLIYKMLPKGKKGDQAFNWFKDNLFTPFAKGTYNATIYKQNLFRDFDQLKKALNISDDYLRQKIGTAGLTNEQAIRLFLWNQNGELPDLTIESQEKTMVLSPQQIEDLSRRINEDKRLVTIASHLNQLTKREQVDGKGKGYVPYDNLWIGGTISTDLINYANGARRKYYLQEWKNNVDQIFSNENKNKLKVIYGKKYVRELENSLQRQWSGKNREYSSPTDRKIQKWINGSVGTIMFWNSKSAILQTVSTANFVNMTDNNPIAFAARIADTKQYSEDFVMLFNGDYLKNRRDGLAIDVEADEISRMVADKTGLKTWITKQLKKGYTPTKWADSFAIAVGGAAFYRNRYNTYIKEGKTEEEAHKMAMVDFQESAEESQQSARGDKISSQQTSTLGKLVLAFANTPMQYARLTKRAGQDLIMGRGNAKEHIAKITYYTFIQSLLFNALSNATDYGLAKLLDDEEELTPQEENQIQRALDGTVSGFLRGLGVGGNVANWILALGKGVVEMNEDGKITKAESRDLLLDTGTSIMPALNSKFRKGKKIFDIYTYRESLRDMQKYPIYDPRNPNWEAVGLGLSLGVNLPADRLYRKTENIADALTEDMEAWQRVGLAAGWDRWTLGIDKPKPIRQRRRSTTSGRGSGRSKG